MSVLIILAWIAAGAFFGALSNHIGGMLGMMIGGIIGLLHSLHNRQSGRIAEQDEKLRLMSNLLAAEKRISERPARQRASAEPPPAQQTFRPFPDETDIPDFNLDLPAQPPSNSNTPFPRLETGVDKPHPQTIPPAISLSPPLRNSDTPAEPATRPFGEEQVFRQDAQQQSRASAPHTSSRRTPPSGARKTGLDESLFRREAGNDPLESVKNWLFGGNMMVRIGLLVLFIGLAFLVRNTAEHITLPMEVRLLGIASLGVILSVIGWRLRLKRPGYGLSLQGGGIAILYLTAYAALRLNEVLTPDTVFMLMLMLMLMLVAFMIALAILQNSAALATIAVAGGFAAPILTATGEGNHIQLFSYYALLNTGILILAWRKAWRVLNLTGFMFTFAIGALWGMYSYHDAYLFSTECFLLLFCLMYIAATICYAWRKTPSLKDPIDSILVFGVPALAAPLQTALVQSIPNALAWSAFGAGVFYLLLGLMLRGSRKETFGLLAQCFSALGFIFLTAAVPLAFSGEWSAGIWALEGAVLWWLGLRQERELPAWGGLLLQLGSALIFIPAASGYPDLRAVPIFNSVFLGGMMIAAAGLSVPCQLNAISRTTPGRCWERVCCSGPLCGGCGAARAKFTGIFPPTVRGLPCSPTPQ